MAKAKKKKRKLSAYNRHMSVQMKKGRTFKQAVASWKGGSKKTTRRRRVVKPKRRRIVTSKRRTRKVGRKGGFNTQKVFKLVRLAALGLPAAGIAMSGSSTQDKFVQAQRAYFGWDPNKKQWSPGLMLEGWGPYLGAIVATYGIPKIAGILRGL